MKDVKIEDLKKTKEITENAVIEMVAFSKKIENENFDLEKEIKDRIEISKDEFRYRNELRTELKQLRDEKDVFEKAANYWMRNYKELENKNAELKSSLWKWLQNYWREGTQCY